MRFMLKIGFPVETANALVRAGKLGSTIQSILDAQKPEAAYFTAENGERTATLILNLQDASQIPAIAEPWFLALNAAIEIQPAMVPEDLAKATPAFEQAAKQFG